MDFLIRSKLFILFYLLRPGYTVIVKFYLNNLLFADPQEFYYFGLLVFIKLYCLLKQPALHRKFNLHDI